MCGILGMGGPRGPELVPPLTARLAHRGPDADGFWSSPPGAARITLGHRRLAIIGLDKEGEQPRLSRSGESVLVFNGEIYNYLELAERLEAVGRVVDRRYDTAVLLEALEAWGIEVLPRLNGMFAFAWYRPEADRLLLVRDRWGKKPLFWGRVPLDGGPSQLVFSSELRTFTQLPAGPPEVDPLGLARYLVYDGMPDTRTIYRGVVKVPAAGWLEVDSEGVVQRQGRYWYLPAPVRDVGGSTEEEAAEAFLEDLDSAVNLRLRSDVPVGLFLSGGLDSSLLASAWRRVRPEGPLRTFTVGFEEPSFDERASARLMADTLGAEHHEIVIRGRDLEEALGAVWDHLSEPFGDPSIVPTSLLCRFARERVTVALGGDGGDELQAGYDPFRAWIPARWMERVLPRGMWYGALKAVERVLPASPTNMSRRFRVRHFAQGFLHPPEERIQGWMASFPVEQALAVLHPDLAAQVDPDEVLEPTRRAYLEALEYGELHAQIHAWIRTYLECCILTKIDRASMMHSLEVRTPFLDPDLAERFLRLPPRLIFRGGKGKFLMRRAAEGVLPPALLRKPKKGLGVPQAQWLRTLLRPRVEEALERNRQGGWFAPPVIENLWQRHLGGRFDYRKALWSFLFAFPFQDRCGAPLLRNETA